jgi:hypothetical protein
VMTDNSSFKPLLRTPVTSLKPIMAQTTQSRFPNANPNVVSQPQGGVPSQVYAPQTRTYPQAGGQPNGTPSHVYNPAPVYSPGQPVYQPQAHATSSGGAVFNPNALRQTAPVNSAPAVNSAGSGTPSHVYERPSAPVSSAPVVHESSSSGGSSGGHAESSAGSSGSTPAASGSGSGSPQSGGGSGSGSAGGPPSRNH